MTSGMTSSGERVAPEDHLRQADPVLGAIIDKVMEDNGGPLTTVPDPALPADPNLPSDHYGVLVRAIVSQNISNLASRAIFQRLRERFGAVSRPRRRSSRRIPTSCGWPPASRERRRSPSGRSPNTSSAARSTSTAYTCCRMKKCWHSSSQ